MKTKKLKPLFRLRLTIERVLDLHDDQVKGYDLDNSKPWPLGHFRTEKAAIAARNSMVILTEWPR